MPSLRTIRRQFLDDIAEQPQTERVRRLGAALLVMHSPTDEIVSIANAKQIFQAARDPKSFLSLDGADDPGGVGGTLPRQSRWPPTPWWCGSA